MEAHALIACVHDLGTVVVRVNNGLLLQYVFKTFPMYYSISIKHIVIL